MNDRPYIAWLRQLAPTAPVALVLPGGRAVSTAPPSVLSLGQLRMRPFAGALVDGLPGVSVGTVQYRLRGWNGTRADPATDVRAVLDALPGAAPVLLVGHSMGGRAAIATADHPRVVGVVGLAPWLPGTDGVATTAGCTVVLAHGSGDRVVPAGLSLRWARRARGVPARLARYVVPGDTHGMLRRRSRWHNLAVLTGAAVLADRSADGLEHGFAAGALGRFAEALPEPE